VTGLFRDFRDPPAICWFLKESLHCRNMMPNYMLVVQVRESRKSRLLSKEHKLRITNPSLGAPYGTSRCFRR
jgi:hypothetical protein